MARKTKTNIESEIEISKVERAEKFFATPEKKKAPQRRKAVPTCLPDRPAGRQAAAKKIISEQIFSKPLAQEEIIQKQIIPEAEVQELIMSMENEDNPQRKISKKLVALVFFVVIFAGAVGCAGYFYYQYKKAISTDTGKNEIDNYVSKIDKFMALPEGEAPTMATVADKEKLSSQPFFAKAENGDKVLFFSKSQKAILYRPSINKIIEATSMSGSVAGNIESNSAQASQVAQNAPEQQAQQAVQQPQTQQVTDDVSKEAEMESQVPQQASVFVNNGTSQKGLAKAMAEKLAQIEGVTIAGTGNAKGNFDKTTVVDISEKNGVLASEIAKNLGGEVGALPEGEIKPDADILVIGGGDNY